MENTNFCQSCGMPMSEEFYGTNQDGSKNSEYCTYCYENGSFTGDMTMENMIEACVPHMVEHNTNMTPQQARDMMNQFFPTLKRWKA